MRRARTGHRFRGLTLLRAQYSVAVVRGHHKAFVVEAQGGTLLQHAEAMRSAAKAMERRWRCELRGSVDRG